MNIEKILFHAFLKPNYENLNKCSKHENKKIYNSANGDRWQCKLDQWQLT